MKLSKFRSSNLSRFRKPGMGEVRKRCEALLADIWVPSPFDIAEFCAYVGGQRSRRISLRPTRGLSETTPCGMWLSIGETDYIFYEDNTSRLHSEHIILHELSHMLSGHSFTDPNVSDVLSRLMPNLNPAVVRQALGRVSYSTEQEQEAELLASLIRQQAGRVQLLNEDARKDLLLRDLSQAFSNQSPASRG
ncbi:hypothetical protein [Streptomyces roseifaciens]|uniref:hypothetical protein n=1 Tax=Streptomyces roseifaciens TaxID=1488406 RepID=UPI001C1FD83F|nr:hypothetical protein [Streptomyces roseifaciens]